MSQARDFVDQVRCQSLPVEALWRQFRFGDGSVAEYHPGGWDADGEAAQGGPGDHWIVVAD